MGNSGSSRVLTNDIMEEYLQLTYLNANEIRRIFRQLDDLAPGKLKENLHHRFTTKQIERVFPQLRCNPFRESIYEVFSSKGDGLLSFEDVLDLCSALSRNCPPSVRAAWAFAIFDFDGDGQVSLDDLIGAIQRLTQFNEDGQIEIDRGSAEHAAKMILDEIGVTPIGNIGPEEFIRLVSRVPDFCNTFCFDV